MKKLLYVLAILLYASGVYAAGKGEQYWLNAGNAAWEKKDFKASISNYKKVLEINPKNAKVRLAIAAAKLNLDDLAGALKDVEAVIKMAPKLDAAYLYRGLIRKELGDCSGAIKDFDRYLKNNKDDIAYYNRGACKHLQEKYMQACMDYNKAIELNPKNVFYYSGRGEARGLMEAFDGAIEDFNAAIALEPNNCNLYIYRGLAKKYNGDREGAALDYRTAIDMGCKAAGKYMLKHVDESPSRGPDGKIKWSNELM